MLPLRSIPTYLLILACTCNFIRCTEQLGKQSAETLSTGDKYHQAQQSAQSQLDFSCNIVHVTLELEKRWGYEVDPVTEQFTNELSASLSEHFSAKRTFDQAAIISYFETLHEEIQGAIKMVSTYHSILSTCLRYGIVDCDVLSMLYISVSQDLGLPVYGWLTPTHMFVAWIDDEHKVFWETTTGQATSLQFYQDKYQLADSSLRVGMNMRPLGRRELVAVSYFNLAKEKQDMEQKNDLALLLNQRAIELAPQWANPHTSQAYLYRQMQESGKALESVEKSIERFPYDSGPFQLHARLLQEQDCPEEALIAVQKAISLMLKENKAQDLQQLSDLQKEIANGVKKPRYFLKNGAHRQ